MARYLSKLCGLLRMDLRPGSRGRTSLDAVVKVTRLDRTLVNRLSISPASAASMALHRGCKSASFRALSTNTHTEGQKKHLSELLFYEISLFYTSPSVK